MTEHYVDSAGYWRKELPTKESGIALRCRLGRHDWQICSVDLSGHQSNRRRRCGRCFDHGRLLIQVQKRGYYGGSIGAPWETETDKRGEIINGRFEECRP